MLKLLLVRLYLKIYLIIVPYFVSHVLLKIFAIKNSSSVYFYFNSSFC